MAKWVLGIYFGFTAILVAAVALLLFSFSAWRAEAMASRANDPLRRVTETVLGPVEYAILGEGAPVLVMSGTPGGYDAALSGPRTAPERALDAMTISVSRPGYRGTPLESGKTFAEQADLMAALLDELGVDRAVIFAAMSGSYPAFQFALRHPERTAGLILLTPNVAPLPPGPPPPPSGTPAGADFFGWLITRSGPPSGDRGDPYQREVWKTYIKTSFPAEGLEHGRRNDTLQSRDPAIADWPLERIAAPTLILHGANDMRTRVESSRALAARMPNAELVEFEGGGRYVTVTHWQEAHQRISAFIDSVPAAPDR